MTLKDTFSSYNLTSEQSILLNKLEEFLSDNSTCFLLKGYAGTGKTFMMKGLTDYLSHNNWSFVIAAPTGIAAKVISKKVNQKGNTIHKTIYSKNDLKEIKTNDGKDSDSYIFYYDIKKNEDSYNTIYIIEEASMISNVFSEGEFFRFGSGYLLNDLIKYINVDDISHKKKILFIGDNAQLPPVSMNFSPALDCNYLREKYKIEAKEFELTEVVRQKSDSGILYNGTILRESLKFNIYNKIEINTDFNDIHKINNDELLKNYLKMCKYAIDDGTIIVAYSNALVKDYNDLIRKHFFPNKGTICKGDKVILVKNNYNYPQMDLMNGDFGFVKEVNPSNENRPVTLKRRIGNNEVIEIKVQLIFREVVISFINEESKVYDIKCKIIENLLYSNQRDMSSDELKALYVDFNTRNPKLKTGTKEFKDALRNDPYFNALRIKFGYAITCHKAQGGEWINTFLNCKTSLGYLNSNYFRWLYTGITRSKSNLFLIDEPHFKIDSNLIPPKIDNITIRQDIIVLNNDVLEIEIPFDFSNEKAFTKRIYLAIIEYLKDEYLTINNIRHTDYLEHYTFIQNNEKVTFKIHYNDKDKITKIEKPTNNCDFSQRINTKLSQIENKTIVIVESSIENLDLVYDFDKPFLKEFYESIKTKLAPLNFQITKIEHKQYHEIYEIEKNGLTATFKFWYDGKNIFKRTEVIQNRTTGLVDEIIELLNK